MMPEQDVIVCQTIYDGRSAEWLINRVIAEHEFDGFGIVNDTPESDGKSVRVWHALFNGEKGEDFGPFDYTAGNSNLGLTSPDAARKIFELSARLDIPLGDMALALREVLIGEVQ